MSERGRVVVMGTTREQPPPGIHVVEEVVDVAYADTVDALATALEGADVLFAWRPDRCAPSLYARFWPNWTAA